MKTFLASIFFLAAICMAGLGASPAMARNGDGSIISGSSSSASSHSHSTANNNGNHQNTTFNDKYQAPGMGQGSLAATGNCPIGSVNLGGSFPGGGLFFGTTKGDKLCRDVYIIQQGWGRRAAPLVQQYVVDQNPEIAKAAKAIGYAK